VAIEWQERDEPEKAADDMLKESRCLLLHKLPHHIAKNSPYCVETLIGGANVVESVVVK
jgi:hypothetical protein